MPKKLTQEEFIQKAREIHHNVYDYSLVNYINVRTKVTIICPLHGEFSQKANSHLMKHGCFKCKNNSQKTDLKNFIKQANEIHNNKYDYSNITCTHSHKILTIICPIHGKFKQRTNSHLLGAGCLKCRNDSYKLTLEKFIEKANIIHDNEYNYSKVDYINHMTKVTIICHIHGEFSQLPNSHLRGNGCPVCKYSHGEREIYNLLKKHNIYFIKQHIFSDCCGECYPLHFDFFIPSKNTLIEYDGIQHYEYIPFLHRNINNFEKVKLYDEIKNNYAFINNINLIRIRYDESVIDKLKSLLET